MMGVFKYTITVESDALPQVVLGQNIGGGIVKELKEVDIELFSASQLAEKYNMSQQQSEIVLCQLIKALLYNPRLARDLLTTKNKRGRPRAN